MRRLSRVSLAVLLTYILVLVALPRTGALATTDLTWEIPYKYSSSATYPLPDYLPQYLGVSRSDLSSTTKLSISLEMVAEDDAQVTASLEVGEQTINLSGRGFFGRFEQTPLQRGLFDIETDAGVAGKLFLHVYPKNNERLVRLTFGEGTTQPETITFGGEYGNIESIVAQWNDYVRRQAKLPSGYELDGRPITLEPAPYIASNQVLVPVRPLLQALGANVNWDGTTQTIIARKGNTVLHLSVRNQTLRVNDSSPKSLVIARGEGGSTFCPLEPLAEALSATVISRNDGRVSLISQEYTNREKGIFQIVFVAPDNLILQNDTNRSYDLSEWALTYYDPYAESGPLQEFRFPADFVLQPGQQVQVAASLDIEPDNRHVFAWQPNPERGPGQLQIRILALEPGSESISVASLENDFYVGNWRLVNAAGKPAFDLPSVWIPKGSSIGINGKPGEPTSPFELRWPNLPAIEDAYAEELARQAESDRQFFAAVRQDYLSVLEALNLNEENYLIYPTMRTYELFNTGEIEPFNGNAAASRSLMYCEWRLTRSLPETGDKLPVYIINRNGEEAYLALIRQDGSFVAYHLEFAMDEGYCAWLDRPVLQEQP